MSAIHNKDYSVVKTFKAVHHASPSFWYSKLSAADLLTSHIVLVCRVKSCKADAEKFVRVCACLWQKSDIDAGEGYPQGVPLR